MMFRKLHIRLTLLFTLFSSAILCVMSTAFLLASEKSHKSSAFFSFQKDAATLLGNLETQQIISHLWLKKMEGQSCKIYLLDNKTPYRFSELNFSDEELALIDQALDWYHNHLFDPSSLNTFRSFHAEFGWSKQNGCEASLSASSHFISGMTLQKNDALLTAIVLAPQEKLHRQLHIQRLFFLAADGIGIMLFFAFSFFFTGKLLKPAREAQQRQIDFIAAASHELRTPLSVILASASACEVAPAREQARFLAGIRREGKRMQGLLSDMLFLASDAPSPAAYSKAFADPETLLLNVYENFEPIAQEKGLALSISLPDEMLPALFCDAEKITQLLSILLQNACSYTPAGGTVTLQAAGKQKSLQLIVSDTGCGIPPAEKAHIFERFYRAESARSQKNHFGLGLCIAQEIVRAHHGRIAVTDNLPCGSVFTVTLPV